SFIKKRVSLFPLLIPLSKVQTRLCRSPVRNTAVHTLLIFVNGAGMRKQYRSLSQELENPSTKWRNFINLINQLPPCVDSPFIYFGIS
ncbi:LOW QUALITY PROTEIN: hypothetical protein TorRG33x02_095000, partial [Trema orientale]